MAVTRETGRWLLFSLCVASPFCVKVGTESGWLEDARARDLVEIGDSFAVVQEAKGDPDSIDEYYQDTYRTSLSSSRGIVECFSISYLGSGEVLDIGEYYSCEPDSCGFEGSARPLCLMLKEEFARRAWKARMPDLAREFDLVRVAAARVQRLRYSEYGWPSGDPEGRNWVFLREGKVVQVIYED